MGSWLGSRTGLMAFAGLLAASATSASAQQAEPFYKGKQIRYIVGTAAGDVYDQWARLTGKYMVKHLPGAPTFIAQNMPGAGGISAANHLMANAEADGTVIAMISRNLPYQALVKQEGVRFDPAKFAWIGSPELTSRVCVARTGAPVQKAEDLFERELLMGGAGAGLAISTTPLLLSRLLGMRFKLIEGYSSNQNILLAMERGEVHGVCQTVAGLGAVEPGWDKSGKYKVLFGTERNPPPGFDVPTIYKFAKTEEQRRIISLYSSSVELGRPIVAPPGLPAERVTQLRNAFEAAMKDPDLVAEATKMGFEIAVTRGQDLAALINDLMSTPPELVEKLKELLK